MLKRAIPTEISANRWCRSHMTQVDVRIYCGAGKRARTKPSLAPGLERSTFCTPCLCVHRNEYSLLTKYREKFAVNLHHW